MSEPVDLRTHRARRTREAGERAHAQGEAFAFAPYTYDDDGIGTIESGEIVVLTDPERLRGLRMSPSDALRLAAALVQVVAGSPEEEH
jgi:hypothetical protein